MKAPDKALWTVKTTYKQEFSMEGRDGEKKNLKSTVRTVRKMGKVIQEKMEAGGETIESIIVGTIRISDQGVKDRAVVIPATDWHYAEFGETDFDRLRWVDMKHYVGVGEHEGKKVFVFRAKGEDKKLNTYQRQQYEYWQRMGGNKPYFISDSVAMLDVETQLPVYYADAEVEETYQFFPAPSTPIVIPEAFKAKLKEQIEYINATTRK